MDPTKKNDKLLFKKAEHSSQKSENSFGGMGCKEGMTGKVKYWNEVQRVYFRVYLINRV